MQQCADFLAEEGLGERRVILVRNLLGTLRNRELAQVANDISAETGLEHRTVVDGQRLAGIYRRSVMLASGCYAMHEIRLGVVAPGDRTAVRAADRGDGTRWRGVVRRVGEVGRQRRPLMS